MGDVESSSKDAEPLKGFALVDGPSRHLRKLDDRICGLEEALAKLTALVDGNHAAHDCPITAIGILIESRKAKLCELEKRVERLSGFVEVQVTGDSSDKVGF